MTFKEKLNTLKAAGFDYEVCSSDGHLKVWKDEYVQKHEAFCFHGEEVDNFSVTKVIEDIMDSFGDWIADNGRHL